MSLRPDPPERTRRNRSKGLLLATLMGVIATLLFRRYRQHFPLPSDPQTGTQVMAAESERPTETARHLWLRNGMVWLALMILLSLTLTFSYIPLGAANTPIAVGIGFIKASLVVWLFMELVKPSALKRLAAATGIVWISVLFALTLADVISRLHGG